MSDTPILNISGYKFVALDNLPELRARFKEKALELDLKGTILLSEEGINAFLAGLPENVRAFCHYLEEDLRFLDMPWKDSYSVDRPFNRMLVRIKKEIISMGQPMICQEHGRRAKAVSTKQLAEWLDKKDDVVLLDTRNDYEVRLGSFENALRLDLHHFRNFPEKVKELLPHIGKKKVVTFCTGGIRCEKAALYMEDIGFEEVYQLDGGILRYFEDCQGKHYDGECFVFDRRVAVDPMLQETQTAQCFACLSPVTPEEQLLPTYVPPKYCPHCVSLKGPKAVVQEQVVI